MISNLNALKITGSLNYHDGIYVNQLKYSYHEKDSKLQIFRRQPSLKD
ncbi:MAG: hypothetical protein ACXABO_13680 [Promethearchaeota archaeon]